MIDWGLAEGTALKLLPNGPAATQQDAEEIVASLYAAARTAEDHIGAVTRMQPIAPLAKVLVVDRQRWATANIEGFRVAITPLMESMREHRRQREADEVGEVGQVGQPAGPTTSVASEDDTSRASTGSAVVNAIGSRATAFQVGTLLAFVGTKVLGQHELFTAPGVEPRLLLVAPNMLVAERNLGVDPHAFRLWVCLHEETHRVQLASVPWLREHIEGDLKAFLDAADMDPTRVRERLGSVVSSVGASVRGETGRSLLDAVQTPEQRAILDRLVALMTLLEGHADWAMDEVGDDVVPGVAQVREKFEQRRDGVGALDQVLRRLFGLDQKLAQYRDGAVFVRAVVKQVGVDGLNAVWTSADTLPMRSEILEPHLWVQRVHGTGPTA